MIRRPPSSPLFPFTTLFRSALAVAHREHDDRHGRPAANRSADVQAAELRQPQVEHNDIGAPRDGFLNRLDAIRRCFDLVPITGDRKSTRLNSSHANISYAVF